MRTIFIVEDEETTRDGLCRLIDWEVLGLRVAGAADDGRTALPRLFASDAPHPDILLTDVKMLYMDGIELAQQVRARRPDMPIVFLSGYGDTQYLRSAIQIGASDYLLKPINFDELAACMRRITERLDHAPAKPIRPGPAQPFTADPVMNASIAHVIRIIHGQYAENITIQLLADQVHLTPNYLSMLFHQQIGQTINGYLAEVRVEKTKELLRQPQMSLRDISIAVGWQNPSFLAKKFRALTGLTPLEYRNRFMQFP